MTDQTSSLATAFADVRRAYRLLHAYHRRLNDLLQFVDGQLARRSPSFAFDRWTTRHADRPPKSVKPFFRPEYWAWDLVPAYRVQCEWTAARKGHTWRVGMVAVADTGFHFSADGEPDPSTFDAVAQCASELWVGLWTATTRDPDWDRGWKKVERLTDAHDGKEHTVRVDGVDYTYEYQSVNLADLVDESAVSAKLLAPIDRWLKKRSASRPPRRTAKAAKAKGSGDGVAERIIT